VRAVSAQVVEVAAILVLGGLFAWIFCDIALRKSRG